MAAKVKIGKVSKYYGEEASVGQVHALDNVSATVGEGEFVSLVGPSGCGKSTLLYILAGFEQTSSGEVRIDGRLIQRPGADRGMVFQDYALFPWKTVMQNVMFGLQIKGEEKGYCEQVAKEFVTLVGLAGFENKFPHELSGGMRQRCALARCVANNPEVLLMDEPLAAIDALTRNSLQEEILKVCEARDGRPRKTVIYVTHSIDEAVFLSDRVILMTPRPGRILDTVDVPLGPFRNDATRLQPEFQELVGKIWHSLRTHLQLTK